MRKKAVELGVGVVPFLDGSCSRCGEKPARDPNVLMGMASFCDDCFSEGAMAMANKKAPRFAEKPAEREEGARCGQCGRDIDHTGCCGYELTECLRQAKDDVEKAKNVLESLIYDIEKDLRGQGRGKS